MSNLKVCLKVKLAKLRRSFLILNVLLNCNAFATLTFLFQSIEAKIVSINTGNVLLLEIAFLRANSVPPRFSL